MNLSNILSERLVQALGWTILHSFWQGALIALVLGVLMLLMRHYSSQSRYFVSIVGLATIFVLAVVTFVGAYQHYQPAEASDVTLIITQEGREQAVIEQGAHVGEWNILQSAENYFREHLPLIVSVWLLGIALLLVRFVGGLAHIQRLRHYKTQEVSAYWNGTLAFLATEMSIKYKVKLLESALAEVPMVIGWLKPVILLPVGTLAGLSVAQVESILAHELAHLKRHDYVVNILQSIAEIVLFYNPFVWWVSGIIREERENCCDDMAVAITGDEMTLVKTLTVLEELRLAKPALAMGFAGRNKGGLLGRVRRLLSARRKASGFSEGFLSAWVLVFCLMVTTANAYTPYNLMNLQKFVANSWEQMQNSAKGLLGAPTPPEAPAAPATPEAPETPEAPAAPRKWSRDMKSLASKGILRSDDTLFFGKDFMIITGKGKEMRIYKAGKEIPKAEYGQYKKHFKVEEGNTDGVATVILPDGNLKLKVDNKQNTGNISIDLPAMPPMPAMPDMPNMPNMPAIPPMPPMPALKIEGDKVLNEDEMKEWEKKMEAWGETMEKWGDDSQKGAGGWEEWGKKMEEWGKQWEKWGEKFEKNAEREAKNAERQAKNAERQARRAEQQAERAKERAEREVERAEDNKRRHEELEKLRESFLQDGIINASDNEIKMFSSKRDGITVNGKTLTKEQEKKYRKWLEESFGLHDGNRRGNTWSLSWKF